MRYKYILKKAKEGRHRNFAITKPNVTCALECKKNQIKPKHKQVAVIMFVFLKEHMHTLKT